MSFFAKHWVRPLARIVAAMFFVALLAGSVQICRAECQTADPGGTSTGAAADVYGMPTASADNLKLTDADKIKKDLEAQKAKEPYAVGLADSVGHVKIATNFGWTLNTGYLVLFMQAGFALLTTGLVRKKNAGHLMMLNFAAYVFAFLAYYAVGFAFQFGATALNAPPGNLGGTPTLDHFALGSKAWGFLGGKGFFLSGPAYDVGANALCLFEVVFMETAGYIIVGAI